MVDIREFLARNIMPVAATFKNFSPSIMMKDGTEYVFVLAKDRSKGYRFHEIFMDYGIPEEIFKEVIKPCVLKDYNEAIWVVEDLKDFYYRKQTAAYYYRMKYLRDSRKPVDVVNRD